MLNSSKIFNYIKRNYKLIFIVLIAVSVRVVAFGRIPGGFNQDGAMAAVDAKYLSETMCDRLGMFMPVHFTAWGFGQMSVLMSYCMIPFIKLLGLSSITARLPILISSLSGLAALYLLSKRTFNEKLAILILFIGAICPWHIMQSRWALDCNMFPHFVLFGILFLVYEKYYLSMIFFALSMYCYGISIYCVPVLLVLCCIYLLKEKKIGYKKTLLCAAVYLLIAWPFITCMIINALGLETIYLPFCTIGYFQNSIRSGDIVFFSTEPFKQLYINAVCCLKIIFQTSNDLLSNQIPKFGTLYLISWPFFVIGLIKLVSNQSRNSGTKFILFWFITAVLNCLITNSVNINRANLIFYPMIIITGMGIYASIQYVKSLKAPIICTYLVAFSLFVFSYFTTYADSIKYVFMEDFGEALKYASSLDADKVYVTPNSQMKGTWYVSEILAMYYCDDYSPEKYSFFEKNNADVLILDESEPGAKQFGRFYVITR